MGYRIVLDANVYVQFAAYAQIERLVNATIKYDFRLFATNHLLHEVFEALHKPALLRKSTTTPDQIIKFLKEVVNIEAELPAYQLSPDYDDNYLFDLAIQYGCLFIVTSDKALLRMKSPPVQVLSTQWFKQNFCQ
jgi:putative PIN family toxin of toxin-antitoxin system